MALIRNSQQLELPNSPIFVHQFTISSLIDLMLALT